MTVESNFERFWETTLSPTTQASVIKHWREHELTAVLRGNTVVMHLQDFSSVAGLQILDVGCGYGGVSIALALAGASVVGTDFDAQRLEGAKIRVHEDHPGSNVRLVRSAGESLPFADNSFDVVVCNDVLEHVQSHDSTLAGIARVLRPGGWLYIQFPNRFSPENLKKDPHYGLRGVSILPPWAGRLYVVRLRRRSPSYDVGTFPVAGKVLQVLHALGIETIQYWPSPRRTLGWLTPALRAYRLNTVPIITAIGRKS
ncbi:MAG: class I SAM-dependent methyltransferase [Anaerolineae bacterium]|nr:class I SAM-dependent methyltransferase [Anaerolineae bacterium]